MSPSPWTPQQESAFTGALRIVLNYVGTLHEITSAAHSRLAALQALLVEKGVLSSDELVTTMAAMKAEHEVLVALDPELEAIRQAMDRLAREGCIPDPDPDDAKGDT